MDLDKINRLASAAPVEVYENKYAPAQHDDRPIDTYKDWWMGVLFALLVLAMVGAFALMVGTR